RVADRRDVGDLPVLADDDRPAIGRHAAGERHVLPIDLALDRAPGTDRDAVGFRDLAILIGEQGEVEVVRLLETLVVLDGVAAYADDRRAELSELVEVVAIAAGLPRASGRHVRRVEVEDDDALAHVIR